MIDPSTIPWQWTRYPGIGLHMLAHDANTGDAAVFIFMKAGCGYPAHRHIGEEHVLVLQGGYEDGLGHYGQGTFHSHPAGSAHAPRATADGDCILFAIAHGGIEILK